MFTFKHTKHRKKRASFPLRWKHDNEQRASNEIWIIHENKKVPLNLSRAAFTWQVSSCFLLSPSCMCRKVFRKNRDCWKFGRRFGFNVDAFQKVPSDSMELSHHEAKIMRNVMGWWNPPWLSLSGFSLVDFRWFHEPDNPRWARSMNGKRRFCNGGFGRRYRTQIIPSST